MREYALRIIVVDEALFIFDAHEHPPQLTALNGQDSAAARRLLRLDLPTIDACPARSVALAAPSKASKAYLLTPLSRSLLLHLRDMAAVSDPFTVAEWAVLTTGRRARSARSSRNCMGVAICSGPPTVPCAIW